MLGEDKEVPSGTRSGATRRNKRLDKANRKASVSTGKTKDRLEKKAARIERRQTIKGDGLQSKPAARNTSMQNTTATAKHSSSSSTKRSTGGSTKPKTTNSKGTKSGYSNTKSSEDYSVFDSRAKSARESANTYISFKDFTNDKAKNQKGSVAGRSTLKSQKTSTELGGDKYKAGKGGIGVVKDVLGGGNNYNKSGGHGLGNQVIPIKSTETNLHGRVGGGIKPDKRANRFGR